MDVAMGGDRGATPGLLSTLTPAQSCPPASPKGFTPMGCVLQTPPVPTGASGYERNLNWEKRMGEGEAGLSFHLFWFQ